MYEASHARGQVTVTIELKPSVAHQQSWHQNCGSCSCRRLILMLQWHPFCREGLQTAANHIQVAYGGRAEQQPHMQTSAAIQQVHSPLLHRR